MPRIIHHQNSASNGPVGIEHLLPSDSCQFTGWLSRYTNTPKQDVASMVRDSWASSLSHVHAIASGLESYNPRSLYHLPCEWSSTHDWLLFDNERHVMFIPAPSVAKANSNVCSNVTDLVRCYDGYQFGYKPHADDNFLRCDSGFRKSCDLQPIVNTDDEYLWEYDETVLEGCWFFTTSCGNRLYYRKNGTIAKWNHENNEIHNAFDSLDGFAVSFVEHYSIGKSNERSPLFY